MRIKKFPWKKIGAGVFIIAAIITILTNLKFVLNCLKFFVDLGGKIFTSLANSIVRDVILFLLIAGILIWLYLINRRIKRTLIATTEEKHITGEKAGVGAYKCAHCGTAVRLDDPDDILPPCPKCNNVEFAKVIAIQGRDFEIMEKIQKLREEIAKLKENLETKDSLMFIDNCYYTTDEEGKTKDGPFCSHCWDNEGKLIRHHISKRIPDKETYWCPVCKTYGGKK